MRRSAAALALALALAACAKELPPPDPRYEPSQSILEVVATLRRHVPDDTYRFEPARDFAGRNVYRSSLIRLESLEHVHEDALRAGYMEGILAFAKGRALERLRAYDLAATSYRRAADREPELRQAAMRSAALCDGLAEAASLGYEADRPRPDGEPPPPAPVDPATAVAEFDQRLALLDALMLESEGTHYAPIVREEIERTDLARAQYFASRRGAFADGNVRALAELQGLVTRHRESKNKNRHLLVLADLYATIAEEYVAARPPESLWFDPPSFQEYVDAASRLYEAVANQDGSSEKLEAARRLEAFLAFTLRVDRDRFGE